MNYSTGIRGVGAIHALGDCDHEYGFYHIHEDAYRSDLPMIMSRTGASRQVANDPSAMQELCR